MQHPNYPNDPNIILKPPLWVHDPDQTYDFFHINRMTDFFLLNPEFYHQFPVDLISTSYKSYGCYIMFDRATFDNYPWCNQYDVILYNYFKQLSGSDAYRTFEFLPENLKIEKPALIFPDDFPFVAVKEDLLLQIPASNHEVVFTWLHKNTDTQWLSETICDKTYRIIEPQDSTHLYKIPCSEMLYGSLVISSEDSDLINQIKAQFINGYEYFLYENFSNLLNIFDTKITNYYGQDLHKIPKTVDFKQFYGYKISTGIWRRHDEYYATQINPTLPADNFIDLTSTPRWNDQSLYNIFLGYGYEAPFLSASGTFQSIPQNPYFTFNDSSFGSVLNAGWQYEQDYPSPIISVPSANSSSIYDLQYYYSIYPLMLSVTWEFVPNWYKENCLLFCYPISEKLAHFRIAESLDLQSANIYYDEWNFYFLPPIIDLPFIHRSFCTINELPLPLTGQSQITFQHLLRIFSHKIIDVTRFYIESDNLYYYKDGTPKNPDFTNGFPDGWSGNIISLQSASTAIKRFIGIDYSIYGNDYANIQYQNKYLCYGIRGNIRLGLVNQTAYSPDTGIRYRADDKARLKLLQWNWDELIFDAQGQCANTWQQSNLTDTIIWQHDFVPFNTQGTAEENHHEISGTLILSNTQNLSDLQIDCGNIATDLDFYNNWKDNIMTDSQRVKDIWAALGAGEAAYFKDQEGNDKPAVMHLSKRIDLMFKTLGFNFGLDGKFNKVRPPVEVKLTNNTLPAGWYLERSGINRGFSANGTPKTDLSNITMAEQQPGIVYKARANKFITDPVTKKRTAIKEGSYYLCNNLLQLADLMMDDLDICFDLQNLGAGVLTIGNQSLEYEGLLSLINELHQTTADTNQTTEQSKIATFICQQLIKEILKGLGLPGEVKQFTYKLQNGTAEVTKNGKKIAVDKVQIPYHGIAEGSHTIFTLFMALISNIAITNIGHLNLKNDAILKKQNISKIPKKSLFNLFPKGKEEKNKDFKDYIEDILKELQLNQKEKKLNDLKDFPTNKNNKNDKDDEDDNDLIA
jgi:hypothetical protein